MLVHQAHGQFGRARPHLRRLAGVRRVQPLQPETEERHRLVDCDLQAVRVRVGDVAGILTLGELRNGHRDVVLLLPLVELLGGTLAGVVGIKGEDNIAGVPLHELHVFFGECRSARGHRRGDATAVETDDIRVALAHHKPVGLDGITLGPVEPVQGARLHVHGCLGGVLVFRLVRHPGQDATTEGDRVPVLVEDGEQHSCPEEVLHPAALVLEPETEFLQHRGRRAETLAEHVPVVGRPADAEPAGDITREPPRAQVITRRACIW